MITTHHKKIAHRLKKKGWDKHYIGKTVYLLQKAEKNKHPNVKKLDNYLFWAALLLVIFGNIMIVVGLLPVIFEMPQWLVIIIFSLIGLCFGLFIDIIFREMDHLTARHYVFAGFFIPLVTLATMFGFIEIGKIIAKEIGIFIKINPLLVILVYVLSFSLPIVEYKVKEYS